MKITRTINLLGSLLFSLQLLAGDGNWQQVCFREVDTLFPNPGQGWMSRRFPSSVTYIRFDWAEVEPIEGQYNWQLIDRAIAAGKPRGVAVAMRVMTANSHTRGYYCSPQWLFELGCKGYEYTAGGGDRTSGGRRIPRIEPDYADPMYLEKHAAFIAALGRRYDGNPNVEFIDIGSYGIWGEWHTPHPVSIAVRRQIIDMYLRAFPQTPLVGMVDDAEALAYTLARGGGYRCDGIGSPIIQSRWKPDAGGTNSFYPPDMLRVMKTSWTNAPVVFEWYGDYDYLKSKNWSYEASVNFMLSNHVSVINDNLGKVPAEAMPQLQKLTRLAGYRFLLREISLNRTVAAGTGLKVEMKWVNVGMGKLYRPYVLQLSLRNATGQTVATTVANADPREWLPGEWDIAAQIMIPSGLPAGEYTLAVTLADKAGQRRALKLAMDAPAKEGWYMVSQIAIK